MSPASSGIAEFERYIGPSLISHPTNRGDYHHHHHHHHHQHQFYPNFYHHNHHQHHHGKYVNLNEGWAGGVPLISFANHLQRFPINHPHHHQQPKDPLTRLVVHTQGAPLILTKTYNRKNKKNNNNQNVNNKKSPTSKCTKDINSGSGNSGNVNGGGGAAVDAVSVTSDESSGSANSENCLPRIIKPRKRRKKDRKPPLLLDRPLSQDGFSTDSASPDIDAHNFLTFQPFIPFHFDPVPDFMPSSTTTSSLSSFNNNSVGSVPNELSETPKLHHSFEDVKIDENDGKDINGNQSNCQCRYCDPSGQIWDVDRNCYSPFLTRPIKFNDYCPIEDLLPKSLIHSMSSLSFNEGVIGDDDDDDDYVEEEEKKIVSKGDLEVSTEIVTSLNGHRDLEIKFYSSSPSSSSSSFTEHDSENQKSLCK